tara:strand:- start:253 stop:435 length:183 start_codon:yes stop_codon:yes gene_type:complete
MTAELWQRFEDIKNDFEKLRCGNLTTKSLEDLENQFLSEQCQAQAQYSGHLVWKVYRKWK